MEAPIVQDVVTHALSLGISGLMFVMWWQERRERLQASAAESEASGERSQLSEMNGQLLGVVRANTEALTALREELRAHRQAEATWMGAVYDKLNEINEQN